MTKDFAKRVSREGIVDTGNYRYHWVDNNDGTSEIRRLPLSSLDTTDAIDGWKTVKTYTRGEVRP